VAAVGVGGHRQAGDVVAAANQTFGETLDRPLGTAWAAERGMRLIH
jgi:hypothetical protein